MQTFMTRRSMGETARDLDHVRLGNQRNEAMFIMDVLTGVKTGYENHPIMQAWVGYEHALGIYGMMMCLEYHSNRRYEDKVFWDFKVAIEELKSEAGTVFVSPPWFQDTLVLRSHRSNLVRKDESYYGEMWASDDRMWPYIWPFIDEDETDGYRLMLSKADKKRLKDGERKLPKKVLSEIWNA